MEKLLETELAIRFLIKKADGSYASPFYEKKWDNNITEFEDERCIWCYKFSPNHNMYDYWVFENYQSGVVMECFLLICTKNDIVRTYDYSECGHIEMEVKKATIVCHYPLEVFFQKSINDVKQYISDEMPISEKSKTEWCKIAPLQHKLLIDAPKTKLSINRNAISFLMRH